MPMVAAAEGIIYARREAGFYVADNRIPLQ